MQTIGTCSKCNGPVQVPDLWGGAVPPVPTCTHCGATAKVVAHGFVDEIAARETKIEALQAQLDWTVKQNDTLLDEGRKLTARAKRLAEALRYAVDNPEFDSETFDNMARTALRDHDQREK